MNNHLIIRDLVEFRGDPRQRHAVHFPRFRTPHAQAPADKLPAHALSTQQHDAYRWPGGVGRNRSIVAFSAICAHQLVYPTRQVSFISFRRKRARQGVQDGLIHCCSENSQYDPARGAQVLAGPAKQPLCAVLLEHDPRADSLTAHATLGGELFDAFFEKYRMKLALDVGPKAQQPVAGQATVYELESFCRNPVRC